MEFGTVVYFPHVAVKTGVEVSPLVTDCVFDLHQVKHWIQGTSDVLEEWLAVVGKVNEEYYVAIFRQHFNFRNKLAALVLQKELYCHVLYTGIACH